MAEMYNSYRPGFLEVICGCMFAGKTEELIRRIKVLEFAKKKIMVFKPALDNRYSDTMVASHAGSFVDSILINKASDIMDHVTPDVEVVAIDEVQFLDEEVIQVCDTLARSGKRVMVAGQVINDLVRAEGMSGQDDMPVSRAFGIIEIGADVLPLSEQGADTLRRKVLLLWIDAVIAGILALDGKQLHARMDFLGSTHIFESKDIVGVL